MESVKLGLNSITIPTRNIVSQETDGDEIPLEHVRLAIRHTAGPQLHTERNSEQNYTEKSQNKIL